MLIQLHLNLPRHEAACDEGQRAGEIVLRELSPPRLLKPADTAMGVSGGFAMRDAVDEVFIGGALIRSTSLLKGWNLPEFYSRN